MTILTTEAIEALKQLAARATEGPWERDYIQTEDGLGRYKAFAAINPEGKQLFDCQNSEVVEIHQEYDEGGGDCWDETGFHDIALACASRQAIPDLIEMIEAQAKRIEELETLLVAVAIALPVLHDMLRARDLAGFDIALMLLARVDGVLGTTHADRVVVARAAQSEKGEG